MDLDIATKSSSIPWFDEIDSENYSTEIPPEVVDNQIGMIVIIALSVVITIGLLFGLAVFIDCRHQKLAESGKQVSDRKIFNLSIPKFFKFRRFSNEEDYPDKAYEEGNIIA